MLDKGLHGLVKENTRKRTAISYYRTTGIPKNKAEIDDLVCKHEEIMNYAKRNHLLLLRSYRDIGYTSLLPEKTGLNKMRSSLRKKEIMPDVVLIYSLNRLGRDVLHNVEIINEMVSCVEVVEILDMELTIDASYPVQRFLA